MIQTGRSFFLGARAVAPILLGVAPFGVIFGAVAASAGASWPQAQGMSLFVFAGAAQLAATQLLAESAPLWVVVLTALVINARFAMYSASLAGQMEHLPRTQRAVMAFFLTDQAYAVCTARFLEEERRNGPEPVHRLAFYLGSALAMYPVWQASTMAGALLGASIDPALGLDFAVPLTFLALAMPALKSRPSLASAAVASVVALAAQPLPWGLSLMAAAVCGIATGAFLEWRAGS